MVVKRDGRVELERMGEFETRNDADVAANDANPCRTGVYDGVGNSGAVLVISWASSTSCRFRFRALWWEIKSTTSRTGLGNPSGSMLVVDVSRLGAIISVVTTSGLCGTIPVFAKAAQMLISVNVRM